MTTKNIEVPILGARLLDGTPKYTPKQWLKRLRQFLERKPKMDTTPLKRGEVMTDSYWSGNRKKNTGRLFLGTGPRSAVPNYTIGI